MEMSAGGLAPPDREEWASLYTAFAILRKESDRALSRYRLTVPQASVLALLAEAGQPVPVSRLAKLLLQESPSMTSLVDRMCDSGLVERTKDRHDRRIVLVKLTGKGRKAHDDVRESAAATSDELFGVLSTEDRATLRNLLQKLAQRNIQRIQ
ncbi:MAG TPA: MarR family transcriptional regulator [Dehalococcoidia bacterium]|nr:MarR family transcriptional regulator [Dehalococcoidia bacterium]